MADVLFKVGTLAQYQALATKDEGTLYFISDQHKIFKGTTDYTEAVLVVNDFPTAGIQGRLYVKSETLEAKIYVGTAWKTINPGYVTSIDTTSEVDDAKLVTVGAIKSYVQKLQSDALAGHGDVVSTTTQLGHVMVDGTTITSTNGKISVGEITQSQVSGLTDDLNSKAPIANPIFTGTINAEKIVTDELTVEMFGSILADPVNDTHITNKKYVDDAIDTAVGSVLGANDAMVFKGTISTASDLPTTHEVGWTYKVVTSDITVAGQKCEIGDMVICVTDGTTADDAHWVVVQTNIDGAVTGPTSSTANHIATFSDASGKVIKDSGFTIASSVPANAKFTDTKYDITVTSASYGVDINLTEDGSDKSWASLMYGDNITIEKPSGASDSDILISAVDTTYAVNAGSSGEFIFTALTNSDNADDYNFGLTAGNGITLSEDMNRDGAFHIIGIDPSTTLLTGYTATSFGITDTTSVLDAISMLEEAYRNLDEGLLSHDHGSDDVTAMTGYDLSSVNAYSAIAATDTLNVAVAKLERGLVTANANITSGDAATLAAAKQYTDEQIEANALVWQTL